MAPRVNRRLGRRRHKTAVRHDRFVRQVKANARQHRRVVAHPTVIDQQAKKTLLPVVRARQALAEGLARYLARGLHRTQREKTLEELLDNND